MTVTDLRTDLDLALAKAAAGIDLTLRQRKLVGLELARRAYLANQDTPTCGQEHRILAQVAGCADVAYSFAALVDAFADWDAVDQDVESWRHRSDVVDTEPMSSDRAYEYTSERLSDAVDTLVGVA